MGIMASVSAIGVFSAFLGLAASSQLLVAEEVLPLEQAQIFADEQLDLQADWQWQAIEGSYCRDGSQAGFFIQENHESSDLMIFLEGGGACFNNQTCGANAANINTQRLPANTGILNTVDDRNPVRSWNKVYIPYCTGDVMAGAQENGHVSSQYSNQKFVGFRNMGLFLQELTYRFAAVDRVLLTGESAGAFGAIYNFDQVQAAFGSTPVYLLNDSGIAFADQYLAPCLQNQWRTLWNLNATLPSDCYDCRGANGGGIVNLIDYLAVKYPDRQFGFISSMGDFTIRIFYGYGNNSCRPIIPLMSESQFRAGLLDVRNRIMNEDFVTFFVSGMDHTFLSNQRFLQTRVQNIHVYQWIEQFIAQQASSVGP